MGRDVVQVWSRDERFSVTVKGGLSEVGGAERRSSGITSPLGRRCSGRCPEGFIALVPIPEADWKKGSALGWYHGVV